jgi:hypothetical protein
LLAALFQLTINTLDQMLSNSTNDFSSLNIAEKTNKAEENAFPSLECQAKGSKQGMLQIVITIYTSYSIFLP